MFKNFEARNGLLSSTIGLKLFSIIISGASPKYHLQPIPALSPSNNYMNTLPKKPTKRPAGETNKPSKKPKLEVQQTLYIRNLNDKINRRLLKHTLYLLFSTYGEVFDINMRLKGQAHIILESKQAAAYALKGLNDVSVCGKKMIIEYAVSKSVAIELAEKSIAEEID